MDMVQRGERPPNVRVSEFSFAAFKRQSLNLVSLVVACILFLSNLQDIDDRPPNPNQPISNSSLVPRAKVLNILTHHSTA